MEIVEISPAYLAEYAQVSSGFEVRNILTVERLDAGWGWGSGGLRLVEQRVAEPYWKDYDSYDEGRPQDWPKEFDLSPWGFFPCSGTGQPNRGRGRGLCHAGDFSIRTPPGPGSAVGYSGQTRGARQRGGEKAL